MTDPNWWKALLAEGVTGWFNHPEALLSLVDRVKPGQMIEVGSFMGASAIPTARLLSRWGGRLWCVDTWGANPAHRVPNAPTDHLFSTCAANLERHNITNVVLYRGESVEAARNWPNQVQFIYVDASHDRHSVAMDLVAWWALLQPGGIIAGDDYGNPDYPGVAEAWEWFIKDSRFGEPGYETGAGRPGLVWLYKPVRGKK